MEKHNMINFPLILMIIVILSIGMFCSCERELDFKYKDIEPVTVIEGELSPAGAKVEVSLTTPMNESLHLRPVKEVEIKLSDLSDGKTYILFPDSSGAYTSTVPGIPGHEYLLEVIGGSFYCKSSVTMYGPVKMDSLQFNWIKMPYDDVAVLKGSFNENPEIKGEYFWMKVFRNGKIYLWQTLDDRGAVDGKISFVTITSRKNTGKEDEKKVLVEGDVITCSVCRISREMHTYLEALENHSNGKPQFDGDLCLGFFMASSPVEQTIIFNPENIPQYR